MKKTILLLSMSLVSVQAFAINANLKCVSYFTEGGRSVNMTIMLGDTAGALVVNSSPANLMESSSTPKTGEKVSLSVQTLPERIILSGQDRYSVAGTKLVVLPTNSNAAPTINIRNRDYNISIETSELKKTNNITVNVQTSQEAYQGVGQPINNMRFTCSK